MDLDPRWILDLIVGAIGAVVGLLGTTRLHAWRLRALESRMGRAEADIDKLNLVNAGRLARTHR